MLLQFPDIRKVSCIQLHITTIHMVKLVTTVMLMKLVTMVMLMTMVMLLKLVTTVMPVTLVKQDYILFSGMSSEELFQHLLIFEPHKLTHND